MDGKDEEDDMNPFSSPGLWTHGWFQERGVLEDDEGAIFQELFEA